MKYLILLVILSALSNIIAQENKAVNENEKFKTESEVKKDTVVIFNKNDLSTFFKVKEKLEKSRKQGYGGGGGWQPGFFAVYAGPISDLVSSEKILKSKSFDISTVEIFAGSGGMGYGGIGNGIRIGGGGFGGSRQFTSKPFGANKDSLITLDTKIGFGYFLFEKVFVINNYNCFFGGTIGGGAIDIKLSKYREDEESAFLETSGNEDDDISESQAEAVFFNAGIHGGFTYTVTSWFHIGLEGDLSTMMSNEGFHPSIGGFFSAQSSMKMRMIFGNLG